MWKPPPPGWMECNVADVEMEIEAGCGRVLRDNKRVAYVMFSGPIEAMGSGMDEVRDIKTAIEMFISMVWHEKVTL